MGLASGTCGRGQGATTKRIGYLALALLAATGSSATAEPARADTSHPTVVLMLFDGFAAATRALYATAELDRLRSEGAWSHQLAAAFPTVSLVNGITVSTGCWPQRHGIVGNRFIDPQRGMYDHSRDPDWLFSCEHIHQVVERQGLRAAALGWYGSRSATRDRQVGREDVEYDCTDPRDLERSAEILKLLEEPASDRPDLIVAYFCGPDEPQHFEGIDSDATRDAVAEADRIVGRIRRRIASLPDARDVTLMVVTDHGMTPVSRLINLTRILRRVGVSGRVVSNDGTAYVYLEDPGRAPTARRLLGGYAEFDAFTRDQPPEFAHLGDSQRVGDLVLVARPPSFFADPALWPWYTRWLAWIGPDSYDVGGRLRADHGYPPDHPDMYGIFYAWGAGVTPGINLGRIEAIDIHPTIARLLHVSPGKPIDGTPLGLSVQ